jgi:hypothetical protein
MHHSRFAEAVALAVTASVAMSRQLETSDGYAGFVARLNPDWCVVECRDRVQWILQRRGSPKKPRGDDWRGRSYCRTSAVLIRCTREHAGAIDPTAAATLAALPERIEEPRSCGD